MAVKKQKKGEWHVQIKRKGIPRVRKTFPTEELARSFEADYIAKHTKKPEENTDQRSLMELIGIWYRQHGHLLSDGVRVRRALDAMATNLGNPIANQLTAEQFLDYRYRRTVTDKNVITAKTFNNQHGYLNAVYRHLNKVKAIDYNNPLDGIDAIPIQERQLGYLSENQIEKLFNSLQALQNKDVWWIAQICIRTGARWGEAEKLTRKQLHNNRVTFEFTKSKKIRTVPLDPEFFKQLSDFIAHKEPNDRVFSNGMSSFRRAVVKSGIKLQRGQMTHVLRHSFASYFMMRGGNILTLQGILGHSDIKMTMKYAHLSPNYAEDALKFNPLSTMKIGT